MTQPADDAGLWKRGLVLFFFIGILAATVLFLILVRPETPPPPEQLRAEAVLPLVAQPGAGFPGSVSWGALCLFSHSLPSPRGWEIRYNAALTLARRGSAETPLDTLAEMLDEQRQMYNFRAQLKDGRNVPDEAAARRTVLNALKAITDWHRQGEVVQKVPSRRADLERVYAAIDLLTHSANNVLRTEAEKTRKALGRS